MISEFSLSFPRAKEGPDHHLVAEIDRSADCWSQNELKTTEKIYSYKLIDFIQLHHL